MHQTMTNAGRSTRRALENQLRRRRETLAATVDEVGAAADLVRLLHEVEQALERLGTDAFGRCEVCGEPLDDEQLLAQPTQRYCLCELTPQQQAALERDLDLAWQVQAALLPEEHIACGGWDAHYRYLPAGAVSGDYCDLLTHTIDQGWLYFLVGDVSGKGVAASYVMAHLSALVRSSLESPVPVNDLVRRIDRHLSERTPSSYFVTLVCGRANAAGEVELCNAGHCLPMVVGPGGTERLNGSDGFPIGIGEPGSYQTRRLRLSPGESLVLYTDGVTETRNATNTLYGADALAAVLHANHAQSPARMAEACLSEIRSFRNGTSATDDVTLMVMRRCG